MSNPLIWRKSIGAEGHLISDLFLKPQTVKLSTSWSVHRVWIVSAFIYRTNSKEVFLTNQRNLQLYKLTFWLTRSLFHQK